MWDYRQDSIADLGGKRILNMGGSLMGYIQTGNPYHKDYYKEDRDSFKRATENKANTKDEKKSSFLKYLLILPVLTIGRFALFELIRHNKHYIKFSEKISKALKLPYFKNVFDNIRKKLKLPSFNDIENKISSTLKLPKLSEIGTKIGKFFRDA